MQPASASTCTTPLPSFAGTQLLLSPSTAPSVPTLTVHPTVPIHSVQCIALPTSFVSMMGKKGLVTSIFSKLVDTSPPCRNNPQTTSFRAGGEPRCTVSAAMQTGRLQRRGEMYKTVNSVYFDDPAAAAVDDEFSSLDGGGEVLGDESCFSTMTASEAVVRSLQGRSTSTHRFFLDPGPPAIRSSVLPTTTTSATPPPEPAPSAASDVPEPDLDDYGKQDRQRVLAEGSV